MFSSSTLLRSMSRFSFVFHQTRLFISFLFFYWYILIFFLLHKQHQPAAEAAAFYYYFFPRLYFYVFACFLHAVNKCGIIKMKTTPISLLFSLAFTRAWVVHIWFLNESASHFFVVSFSRSTQCCSNAINGQAFKCTHLQFRFRHVDLPAVHEFNDELKIGKCNFRWHDDDRMFTRILDQKFLKERWTCRQNDLQDGSKRDKRDWSTRARR